MRKMLCPYCDHEIAGKGLCNFCGSKVKKPVYVEVADDLDARFSAQPGETIEKGSREFRTDGAESGQTNSSWQSAGQDKDSQTDPPPRTTQARPRAMLASEAVAESTKKGTAVTKGRSTASKVVTVLVVSYFVWLVISLFINLL